MSYVGVVFFFFQKGTMLPIKIESHLKKQKDDHLRKTKEMNDAKIYLVLNNMALHTCHPSTWEIEAGGPEGQDFP